MGGNWIICFKIFRPYFKARKKLFFNFSHLLIRMSSFLLAKFIFVKINTAQCLQEVRFENEKPSNRDFDPS